MITESNMLQGRKFYIEGTFYPFWTSTLQVFAPFDTSAATLKKQGMMSVFAWQSMLLVGLVACAFSCFFLAYLSLSCSNCMTHMTQAIILKLHAILLYYTDYTLAETAWKLLAPAKSCCPCSVFAMDVPMSY